MTSLKNLLTELIRLSYSMGNCPYEPPLSPPASPEPVDSAATATAAGAVGSDPSRAEYLAAVRGLFGPEAGPVSDKDKFRKEARRRRRRGAAAAAGDAAAAAAAGGGGGGGGGVSGDGLAGKQEEKGGSGVDGDRDNGSAESMRAPAVGAAAPGAPVGTAAAAAKERAGQEERHLPQAITGRKAERRRWETPEEARERLRLRLDMAWRGVGVATAAAAATAAIMARAGSRRSEGWAVAANKASRSSGVLALHGKALSPEDAEEGGRPGVTWCVVSCRVASVCFFSLFRVRHCPFAKRRRFPQSLSFRQPLSASSPPPPSPLPPPSLARSSHPHFRKYFTLLRLGIPREEVGGMLFSSCCVFF